MIWLTGRLQYHCAWYTFYFITILHTWNSNQSNRVDNTGPTNFLSFCGPDHAHSSKYASTSPLLFLQLHQQQQLLSINIINSTNHHLQHSELRILLQHLTSHAAYERSGGPPKRPAAKRSCNTVRWGTLQYSTVQNSTAQHSTVPYSTVQCRNVQCSTCSTAHYSTVV